MIFVHKQMMNRILWVYKVRFDCIYRSWTQLLWDCQIKNYYNMYLCIYIVHLPQKIIEHPSVRLQWLSTPEGILQRIRVEPFDMGRNFLL